jgi:riboflavin biosynthesis pyrimidine reductase
MVGHGTLTSGTAIERSASAVIAGAASGYHQLFPAAADGGGDPLIGYAAERPTPADRPWVLANFVAGLDGSVAVDGRVGPLTSPADQRVFHHLRSFADLVMVGAGTVRAEGYEPARSTAQQRAARLARGQSPVPPIAVISASLRLDVGARFFTATDARPMVICPAAADPAARQRLSEHADILCAGDRQVDLGLALRRLRTSGVHTVLCEGGPAVIAELLAADLLDELCLTIAPLMGGDSLRLVGDRAATPLVAFELAHVLSHDSELYLRYVRHRANPDG